MEQELLLQRDELARKHQLGELQKEYTTWAGRQQFALWGIIALVVLIIASIAGYASLGLLGGLLVVLICIAVFALIGLIAGWSYYYYHRQHIYLYTGGLIYLNGNKRRVVRWEQIARVSSLLSNRSFTIYMKDQPRLGLGYVNRADELYSTIEGEVYNPRSQRPTPSPGKLSDPGPQTPVYAGAQPGGQKGSHTQQDEFARAYQLGEFQKEYTVPIGKRIRDLLFGTFMALITLIPTIGRVPFLWTLIITIFWALVIGSVLARLIYSYYRQARVYLYTDGILYLHGSKKTAVRWEQINRVSRSRGGAVIIDWGGPTEPKLRLTSLLAGIVGLYSTIKREVDTRRSGQAQEKKESVSMRCQNCNTELSADAAFCYHCGRPVLVGTSVTPEVSSNAQESTISSSEQFGSYLQTPDYPAQPPVPDVEQQPSQVGFAGQQSYQGTMSASQINVQPPLAVAPPTPNRRMLWVILGSIGALVLIGSIVFVVILLAANGPSAASTLNAYCNALKSGDYQAAYNQFSSGLQGQVAELEYTKIYSALSDVGLGKVTNCAVSNVNDSAGSGIVSITFASNNTLIQDVTAVNQNGNWKINSYQTRSSPTLTLVLFCSDLETQNYQAAYNLLSSERQSQQSEAQFASLWTATVSSCTVSNIDDAAGTGTILFQFVNGGGNARDYSLVNENGTWKIVSSVVR